MFPEQQCGVLRSNPFYTVWGVSFGSCAIWVGTCVQVTDAEVRQWRASMLLRESPVLMLARVNVRDGSLMRLETLQCAPSSAVYYQPESLICEGFQAF